MSRWNHEAIDMVTADEDVDPDVEICNDEERVVSPASKPSARRLLEERRERKRLGVGEFEE